MSRLPDDLAGLDGATLDETRKAQDERLAKLFRRWPSLSRRELSELRHTWSDRVRVARHLGRRRGQ